MAQLPWVRLDTQLPWHPKVLALIAGRQKSAVAVFAMSLAYCGGNGTDGYIPREALPFIHGTKAEAAALVEVGLWDVDTKGWIVHDWADRQQTSEVAANITAAKRVGSKKGNCVRWHGADCGCWRGLTAV